MKQKGIILKIQSGYCYVLTTDRQFLKVPALPDVQIGQEIEWVGQGLEDRRDRKRSKQDRRSLWKPVAGLVAAVVLTIGIWQSDSFFQPAKAYAYVGLDINPSIELAVDNKNHVLQQEAMNDDGKKVLSEVSIIHQDVQKAIEQITEQANKDGFLKKDSDILITTTPAEPNQDAKTLQSVSQLQNSLVTEVRKVVPQQTVLVKGLTVSQNVRQAAEKVHLSPGKFAVYLQAQSQGVPVTVDEVRQQPLSNLAKQNKDLQQSIESVNSNLLDDLLSKWNHQQADSKQGDTSKSNGAHKGQGQGKQEKASGTSDNSSVPADTNANDNKGQSNKHDMNSNGNHNQNSGSGDGTKHGSLLPQPSDDTNTILPNIDVNPILKVDNNASGPESYAGPFHHGKSDNDKHKDNKDSKKQQSYTKGDDQSQDQKQNQDK